MSRRLLLLVCLAVTQVACQNATSQRQAQNKTKRGLTEQTRTFHDVDSFKPLILYPELAAAAASHSESYADGESPKQLAAQQVLYEYQQTPSTTISNVHVNQFHAVPETADSQVVYASQLPPTDQNLEAQPNQQSLSVQNVVHPVQHSTLIKHGQNYGQVAYQPSSQVPRTPAPVSYQPTRSPHPAPLNQYVSTTVQPTQSSYYSTTQHFPQQQNPFAQGKYLYVNGKILYYPQGVPTTPVAQSSPYPGTQVKHPAISYQNHQARPRPTPAKPLQKLTAAPTPAPTPAVQYYNSYVPKKLAAVSTTTVAPAPVKQQQRDEAEEDDEEEEVEERPRGRPVEEDDEEEDEEEEDDRPARYRDDDDDEDEDEYEEARPQKYVPKYYRSKYLYAPTNEELEAEEEEDEDSDREQSKLVKQKTKKPKKYYKEDTYLKPRKEKNKYDNFKSFVFFDPLKESPRKTSYEEPEPKYSKVYASYKSPQKKTKAKVSGDVREEPQMEYSVYKYHKVEPKVETMKKKKKKQDSEARFSENVPVIHTQKVIKKQWLVTKTEQ